MIKFVRSLHLFPTKHQINLKWIPTSSILNMVIPKYFKKFSRNFSLDSVSGEWDKATVPLEFHPKAIYCRSRWQSGLDWKQTIAPSYYRKMISNYGSFDKCTNDETVLKRLNDLDYVFSSIQGNGALKTRFELSLTKNSQDETGGIYVHFDRNGDPIFAGGGWHRLMIAKILEIKLIPIQIGLVHKSFLQNIDLKGWITSNNY